MDSGDVSVTSDNLAYGIVGVTTGEGGKISITNSGDLDVRGSAATGIFAYATNDDSAIEIVEQAAITATGDFVAYGISALTVDDNSNISITNSSHITATAGGLYAIGINAITTDDNSSIRIVNRGDIAAETAIAAYGIRTLTTDIGSRIDIESSGNITEVVLRRGHHQPDLWQQQPHQHHQ